MAQENLKPYLTGISHYSDSEMACYRHTLPLVKSKPRSCLEAAQSMATACPQYPWGNYTSQVEIRRDYDDAPDIEDGDVIRTTDLE